MNMRKAVLKVMDDFESGKEFTAMCAASNEEYMQMKEQIVSMAQDNLRIRKRM